MDFFYNNKLDPSIMSIAPDLPKPSSSVDFLPETNMSTFVPNPSVPIQPAETGVTIPINEISQPVDPVPKMGERLPSSNLSSQLASIKEQALQIQERVQAGVGEPTQATAPNSLKQQAIDGYLFEGNRNLSGDKETIRNEARVAQKEEKARNLFNRITERDNYYRDEIERLEKNPEGMSMGALNATINDLERERSREMADLSFAYRVAEGDYAAAQSVVDARIADLEADRQNRMNMWLQAWNFAQNDLTDSEKIQAQQNFDRQMAEQSYQQQLEIIGYEDQLARNRDAINRAASGSGDGLFDPSTVKEINGSWFEWDPVTGEWVPFEGGAGASSDTDGRLNSISFARSSVENILGNAEKGLDPLYKRSGRGRTAEFFASGFGLKRNTEFAQLRAYADTLRSNMLLMGGDPNIRDFFGPQMSERDVEMMMSQATALNVDGLEPTQLKTEVERIDNFLGKYEAAVRAKQQGLSSQPNYTVAPDGTAVIIVD